MKKSRRHALGQHFLASPAVLRKIVDVISPRREDVLVEIGAGKGILTAALAERAGRVIAIEKDGRLIPGLRKAVPGNVEVVEGDALTFDFRGTLRTAGIPAVRLVGNLPYSISSPILRRVLEERDLFTDCVFLLQKEVAARIPAGPGSKKYAPLSILLQNYFEARIEFTVAPGSFSPPPKVQSALLSLRRRPAPLHAGADDPKYAAFLRSAFSERRKQLRKNLERRVDAGALAAAFERCGLLPNVRAEQVTPEAFAALFNALRQGTESSERPSEVRRSGSEPHF
jgi:16S rRNA (adenine1518-N6/adenine1519-N6)-dimethyltransferase